MSTPITRPNTHPDHVRKQDVVMLNDHFDKLKGDIILASNRLPEYDIKGIERFTFIGYKVHADKVVEASKTFAKVLYEARKKSKKSIEKMPVLKIDLPYDELFQFLLVIYEPDMTCVLPRETADFLRLTSLLNTCRIFGATSLLACLARGLRRSLTLLIKDLTFYFIPVSEHRDIKSFPSLPEPCHLIRILTDFNLTDILPYAYFYLYRVNELTHVLDLRTYRLPEETKPNMEWLHPHEIGMFTHAQRELNNATDAAYKHIDSLYAEWECPSRSGRCNRRFAEYREECRARGVHFPYAGKVYPKMGYQEMCPGCKEAYERWMENVVLKYFMKLVKAVFGRVGMGMYRDNRTNGRSEQQRYELDGNQSNMKGNGEFKSTYEVFQGRREWGRKDPPRYPATRVELLYTHRYDRRPTPAPDHRSTDGWQRPYAVNNHMVLTDQRMAPKGIQPGRAYDRVGSIPIRMFSTASS